MLHVSPKVLLTNLIEIVTFFSLQNDTDVVVYIYININVHCGQMLLFVGIYTVLRYIWRYMEVGFSFQKMCIITTESCQAYITYR